MGSSPITIHQELTVFPSAFKPGGAYISDIKIKHNIDNKGQGLLLKVQLLFDTIAETLGYLVLVLDIDI